MNVFAFGFILNSLALGFSVDVFAKEAMSVLASSLLTSLVEEADVSGVAADTCGMLLFSFLVGAASLLDSNLKES